MSWLTQTAPLTSKWFQTFWEFGTPQPFTSRSSAPRRHLTVLTRLPSTHANTGFEFRLYVVPADLPDGAPPFISVSAAAREAPPRSALFRLQLESAAEERESDRLEHGLYLAYVATRRAMQAIASTLSPAGSSRGFQTEFFDDGAELVSRGVIRQEQSALMRETRQFLEAVSYLEFDQLLAPGPWEQRADFLFERIGEMGAVVIRILQTFERPGEAAT